MPQTSAVCASLFSLCVNGLASVLNFLETFQFNFSLFVQYLLCLWFWHKQLFHQATQEMDACQTAAPYCLKLNLSASKSKWLQ